MHSYIEKIRERVIHSFNLETARGGRDTYDARIMLVSGDWVNARLISNDEALFVVETYRDTDGMRDKRLEIPYLSVCAIEIYHDRE